MTKVCEVCGKEFTPDKTKTGIQKFCSFECYRKIRNKRMREARSAMPKRVIICPVCGKEFNQTYRNQKYCSDDCKIEIIRERKRMCTKKIREDECYFEKSSYPKPAMSIDDIVRNCGNMSYGQYVQQHNL